MLRCSLPSIFLQTNSQVKYQLFLLRFWIRIDREESQPLKLESIVHLKCRRNHVAVLWFKSFLPWNPRYFYQPGPCAIPGCFQQCPWGSLQEPRWYPPGSYVWKAACTSWPPPPLGRPPNGRMLLALTQSQQVKLWLSAPPPRKRICSAIRRKQNAAQN